MSRRGGARADTFGASGPSPGDAIAFFSSMTSKEPPILSAPFQTHDRWLLWPRLQLYVDRIDLTEWWGRRRVWCRLPLDAVARVEARTSTTLVVRAHEEVAREGGASDCVPITIEVDEASRWAQSIRAFRSCIDDSV